MSIELQSLQRLAVYIEPSGSFTTDETGTPSSFEDVPFVEGSLSWTPGFQTLDIESAQQSVSGFAGRKMMTNRYASTLTFTMDLAPTGTAVGTSGTTADETSWALGRILKTVMGGIDAGNEGSTITSVADAGEFDITTADNDHFDNGNVVGLINASDNNAMEIREVDNVSGDTVQTRHTGTFTPTTTQVYAGTTFYLTENPADSLQFIVEGAEQDDRWAIYGCQATGVTFDFPTDGFPRVTFTFQGVHYKELSAQAITTATYNNYDPQWMTYDFISFPASATSKQTATTHCTSARGMTLNLQYTPVICPGETYGVQRWVRTRAVPQAEVTFTSYFEDLTWFNAAEAETEFGLSQQFNNVAGSSLLASWPTVQITNVERSGDTLAEQTVTGICKLDVNGSTSTDLRKSPFRLHFA